MGCGAGVRCLALPCLLQRGLALVQPGRTRLWPLQEDTSPSRWDLVALDNRGRCCEALPAAPCAPSRLGDREQLTEPFLQHRAQEMLGGAFVINNNTK